MIKECPNHEGHFDCTPFCKICEGEQEYSTDGGIYLENVDFEMLDKQRIQLIKLLGDDPDSDLWGIVEMLDYMVGFYERNLK